MSHANFYLEPAEPLRSALNALKTTTGLSASLLANHVAEHGSRLAIKAPHGQEVELTVEVKATVDRRDQLSTFKYRYGGAVLVTRSLSNAMAEQCRALNIQFLDTAGNCFLNQTGMFVFVSGRKETTLAQAATTRGLTPGTGDERSIDTAATVKKRILNHVAGKSRPATQPTVAGTDPHTR